MTQMLLVAALLAAQTTTTPANTGQPGVRGAAPLEKPAATEAAAVPVRAPATDTTETRRTARRLPGDHLLIALTHSEETFTSARASWREDLVSVRLNASGMAAGRAPVATKQNTLRRTVISFEGGRAERFAQQQGFGGFDYYRTIVSRTYANLRLRFAPRAVVIPEFDVLFEVTGGTSTGWEASVGVRQMRYKKSSVNILSGGAAKYYGLWYFRGRLSVIPVAGSVGTAVVVAARRYFRSGDELLELVVSNGREVVTGPKDVLPEIRQSVSGLARFQYFLTPTVGMNVGASYTADSGLSRWGLIAGIQTRL